MARSTAARSPEAPAPTGVVGPVEDMPHTVGLGPPESAPNRPGGGRSEGTAGWFVVSWAAVVTRTRGFAYACECHDDDLSWIPSDSVWGPPEAGFDLGLSHWDQPMPERLAGVADVDALHDAGRFRFANVLQGWVDIDDGRIVGHGFGDRSGLVMGDTTVRLARGGGGRSRRWAAGDQVGRGLGRRFGGGRWCSGRRWAGGRRSRCPGRCRTRRSSAGRRRWSGRRWR